MVHFFKKSFAALVPDDRSHFAILRTLAVLFPTHLTTTTLTHFALVNHFKR